MESFVPDVLVTARESRGLTQQDLARESGTSQGMVSKAENGQNSPDPTTIEAWARALRYPIERFYRPTPNSLSALAYRKRATTKRGDIKLFEANLKMRLSELEVLLRAVEVPEDEVPRQEASTSLHPAAIANLVRQEWQVPRGPIVDLSGLLESHGIVVFEVEFGSTKIDGLSQVLGQPTIFIRKGAPWDRLRFTLAHELGHIVLQHHRLGAPSDDIESDADLFASEFLMPSSEIRGALTSSLDFADLARLKERWGVSMQSLLTKAKQLSRISEAKSRRMWIELSTRGWRKKEPVDIEPENPWLVHELVRVHREDLGYSPEEIAASVWLSPVEFRELYMAPEANRLRLLK